MSADIRKTITPALSGLDRAAWFYQLEDVVDDLGAFNFLGRHHASALIDAGPCLLVTFEVAETIIATQRDAEPVGFDFVRQDGWSHLCLLSKGETWFRDPYVYSYFDRLIDDGFFDRFDRVLFYGIGSGGYAAASYSVAVPGARVLALRPQATLDPRVTGFDPRFRTDRKRDFTSRYGYAPDMIDAAKRAYIAVDPLQKLDAIHAALFTRANVTALRCTGLGPRLDQALQHMGVFHDLIRMAMDGAVTDVSFAKLMRARRNHVPFLRRLYNETVKADRHALAATLCAHALRHGHDPFFADALASLVAKGHTPLFRQKIRAAE